MFKLDSDEMLYRIIITVCGKLLGTFRITFRSHNSCWSIIFIGELIE